MIHQRAATNRRVILSRDRIITRKRNKLTIIAVAGALSMATAGSAAATVWPAARSADTAFTRVTIPAARAASQLRAQKRYLSQQAMAIASPQAVTVMLVRQAEAARDAAAVKAARKAAAVKTARKAAAKAAQQKTAPRPAAVQAAARLTAAQRAAAQQAASRQAVTTVPTVPSSPRNIAVAMLATFGWSSNQFSCLQPLWAAESGWRVNASNPNTGAYGIPQALPGSKMASAGADWQSDAATQIRWGLGYIKGSYGSPCAAWGHQRSTGWY
ncbi:MAG TPA: hypothetical protein VE733_22145 [Streptosporangiaceae bacterium]|nr:hypothetical protein [Streptosporangiaceae bacterium]